MDWFNLGRRRRKDVQCSNQILPIPYVVRGKVLFSVVFVCLFTRGGWAPGQVGGRRAGPGREDVKNWGRAGQEQQNWQGCIIASLNKKVLLCGHKRHAHHIACIALLFLGGGGVSLSCPGGGAPCPDCGVLLSWVPLPSQDRGTSLTRTGYPQAGPVTGLGVPSRKDLGPVTREGTWDQRLWVTPRTDIHVQKHYFPILRMRALLFYNMETGIQSIRWFFAELPMIARWWYTAYPSGCTGIVNRRLVFPALNWIFNYCVARVCGALNKVGHVSHGVVERGHAPENNDDKSAQQVRLGLVHMKATATSKNSFTANQYELGRVGGHTF